MVVPFVSQPSTHVPNGLKQYTSEFRKRLSCSSHSPLPEFRLPARTFLSVFSEASCCENQALLNKSVIESPKRLSNQNDPPRRGQNFCEHPFWVPFLKKYKLDFNNLKINSVTRLLSFLRENSLGTLWLLGFFYIGLRDSRTILYI